MARPPYHYVGQQPTGIQPQQSQTGKVWGTTGTPPSDPNWSSLDESAKLRVKAQWFRQNWGAPLGMDDNTLKDEFRQFHAATVESDGKNISRLGKRAWAGFEESAGGLLQDASARLKEGTEGKSFGELMDEWVEDSKLRDPTSISDWTRSTASWLNMPVKMIEHGLIKPIGDLLPEGVTDEMKAIGEGMAWKGQEGREEAGEYTLPRTDKFWDAPGMNLKHHGASAGESVIGEIAPVLAAAYLTRSYGKAAQTIAGLGTMQTKVYGQEYSRALEETGGDHDAASERAFVRAGAETLPETVPFGIAINAFEAVGQKLGALGILGSLFLTAQAEGASEAVTEIINLEYDENNLGEHITRDEWFQRVKDAYIVGQLMGVALGAPGAAAQALSSTTHLDESELESLLNQGIAPVDMRTGAAIGGESEFDQLPAPEGSGPAQINAGGGLYTTAPQHMGGTPIDPTIDDTMNPQLGTGRVESEIDPQNLAGLIGSAFGEDQGLMDGVHAVMSRLESGDFTPAQANDALFGILNVPPEARAGFAQQTGLLADTRVDQTTFSQDPAQLYAEGGDPALAQDAQFEPNEYGVLAEQAGEFDYSKLSIADLIRIARTRFEEPIRLADIQKARQALEKVRGGTPEEIESGRRAFRASLIDLIEDKMRQEIDAQLEREEAQLAAEQEQENPESALLSEETQETEESTQEISDEAQQDGETADAGGQRDEQPDDTRQEDHSESEAGGPSSEQADVQDGEQSSGNDSQAELEEGESATDSSSTPEGTPETTAGPSATDTGSGGGSAAGGAAEDGEAPEPSTEEETPESEQSTEEEEEAGEGSPEEDSEAEEGTEEDTEEPEGSEEDSEAEDQAEEDSEEGAEEDTTEPEEDTEDQAEEGEETAEGEESEESTEESEETAETEEELEDYSQDGLAYYRKKVDEDGSLLSDQEWLDLFSESMNKAIAEENAEILTEAVQPKIDELIEGGNSSSIIEDALNNATDFALKKIADNAEHKRKLEDEGEIDVRRWWDKETGPQPTKSELEKLLSKLEKKFHKNRLFTPELDDEKMSFGAQDYMGEVKRGLASLVQYWGLMYFNGKGKHNIKQILLRRLTNTDEKVAEQAKEELLHAAEEYERVLRNLSRAFNGVETVSDALEAWQHFGDNGYTFSRFGRLQLAKEGEFAWLEAEKIVSQGGTYAVVPFTETFRKKMLPWVIGRPQQQINNNFNTDEIGPTLKRFVPEYGYNIKSLLSSAVRNAFLRMSPDHPNDRPPVSSPSKYETIRSAEDYSIIAASQYLYERLIYENQERGLRKAMRRPHVNIKREGRPAVRKGNVTIAQFRKEFGFNSGKVFGKWVSTKEEQKFLNAAWDAFADLADHMGIPRRAIGRFGQMYFTIGKIGSGKHLAFFSPDWPATDGDGKPIRISVINVTKTGGDGSLAHELGHSLDYLNWRDEEALGRDKINQVKSLIGTVLKAPWSSFSTMIPSYVIQAEQQLKTYEKSIDNMINGEAYHSLDDPKPAFGYTQETFDAEVERIMERIRNPRWGDRSRFLNNAAAMGEYWQKYEELIARSFESWIYDSMEGKNTYLVDEWVEEGKVSPRNGYDGTPYPEGIERQVFNEFWQRFMALHTVEEVDGKKKLVLNPDEMLEKETDSEGNELGFKVRFEVFEKHRKEIQEESQKRLDAVLEKQKALQEKYEKAKKKWDEEKEERKKKEEEEQRKKEQAEAEEREKAEQEAAEAELAEWEALVEQAEAEDVVEDEVDESAGGQDILGGVEDDADLSDEDIDNLIDQLGELDAAVEEEGENAAPAEAEAIDNEEKKPPRAKPKTTGGPSAKGGRKSKPKPEKLKPDELKKRSQQLKKDAAAAAAKAKEKGVKGIGESLDALSSILNEAIRKNGAGGTLNSDLLGTSLLKPFFDKETYAKAKPHLKAAFDAYREAGYSFVDAYTELKAAFKVDAQRFRAWLTQFMKETGMRKDFTYARPENAEAEGAIEGYGFLAEESETKDKPKEEAPAKDKINQDFRDKYETFSKGWNEIIRAPRNFVTAMKRAMLRMRVALKIDDVDAFVMEKLGYKPEERDKFYDHFMAAQIDAIGMAIYQHENHGKAIIIGDQTGVGKGRQGAAMLLYALRNGYTPVFVSAGTKLFSDTWRDLTHIGAVENGHVIKPLIVNAPTGDNPGRIEEEYLDKDGEAQIRYIYATDQKTTGEALRHWERTRLAPDDFNAIFFTYSQIRRSNFQEDLQRIVPKINPFYILDEAHLASGQQETKKDRVAGITGAGRIAEMIADKPVTYLSATFAKRADNFLIYFRTSIMDSVDDVETLNKILRRGGNALRAAISAELARAGQLFRRELSWDGIDFKRKFVGENKDTVEQQSNALSNSLRKMIDWDKQFTMWLKDPDVQEWFIQQAGWDGQEQYEDEEGNMKDRFKVDHTILKATMHNVINLFLLASKSDAIVKETLERIAAGEKVVIGFQDLGDAAIQEMIQNGFFHHGEITSDANFIQMLRRTLNELAKVRVTDMTVKPKESLSAVDNRKRMREARKVVRIDMHEYDYPTIQGFEGMNVPSSDGNWRLYDPWWEVWDSFDTERARDRIKMREEAGLAPHSSDEALIELENVPLFFLDYIHHQLQKAGVSTSELTGRSNGGEYLKDGKVKLVKRSPPQKNKLVRDFQNNETDVILINKSGTTGLSLHSIPTLTVPPEEVKKRTMLVVQPITDISEMQQLLGRINRNKQTIPPEFLIFGLKLPGEKRQIGSMLAKMKELNANTAGATDSEATSITDRELVDMFNFYGDEIANSFLLKHADYANAVDLRPSNKRDQYGNIVPEDGFMAKLTKGLFLLPVFKSEENPLSQEAAWEELIESYLNKIAYLDSIGQNELKNTAVDLQAEIIENKPFFEGSSATDSFSGNAVLHKVSVINLIKPFKGKALIKALRDANEAINKVMGTNLAPAKASLEHINYIIKEADKKKNVLLERGLQHEEDTQIIETNSEKKDELTKQRDELDDKMRDFRRAKQAENADWDAKKDKEYKELVKQRKEISNELREVVRVLSLAQNRESRWFSIKMDLQAQRKNLIEQLLNFKLGRTVNFVGEGGATYRAVSLGFEHNWKEEKGGNPLAFSNFTVKFMGEGVHGKGAVQEFTLSSLLHSGIVDKIFVEQKFYGLPEVKIGEGDFESTHKYKEDLFTPAELLKRFNDTANLVKGRETRYIATGNLIGGYNVIINQLGGGAGIGEKAVQFTAKNGQTYTGILFPRNAQTDHSVWDSLQLDVLRLPKVDQVMKYIKSFKADGENSEFKDSRNRTAGALGVTSGAVSGGQSALHLYYDFEEGKIIFRARKSETNMTFRRFVEAEGVAALVPGIQDLAPGEARSWYLSEKQAEEIMALWMEHFNVYVMRSNRGQMFRAGVLESEEGNTTDYSFDGLSEDLSLRHEPSSEEGVRESMSEAGETEGWYDIATGKVHFVGEILSQSRRLWVEWHEKAHQGSYAKFGKELLNELRRANTNRYVRELANAIRAERKNFGRNLSQLEAVEEAIAELRAAERTKNYLHIEQRYGLRVPFQHRIGVAGAVARFMKALQRIMAKVLGIADQGMTDAEVWRVWRNVEMAEGPAAPPAIDRNFVRESISPDTWFEPATIKRTLEAAGGFMKTLGKAYVSATMPVRRELQKIAKARQEYFERGEWKLPLVKKGISFRGVSSVYSPLGELPDKKAYLAKRNKIHGKIGDAMRMVDATMGALSEVRHNTQLREEVFTYMTTPDAPATMISHEVTREAAVRIKELINEIGLELVASGILAEESREKYADQYLPRLYLAHLLESKDWLQRLGYGKKSSTQGYTQERKDLPEEYRKIDLGEITHPDFLAAVALGVSMRDMAIVELLDWVGTQTDENGNYKYVYKDSIIDWEGKRRSVIWLQDQHDLLLEMAEVAEPSIARMMKAKAATMKPIIDAHEAMLATPADGLSKELPDYKQVPRAKRYGSLRGAWIRKEIYDDMIGSMNQAWAEGKEFSKFNPIRLFTQGDAGTTLTRHWKGWKVPMNPPSWFRNFASNMSLMNLSGVPMARIPDLLISALTQIIDDVDVGPYGVAKREGITHATFSANELHQVHKHLIEFRRAVTGETSFFRAVNDFGKALLGLVDASGNFEAVKETGDAVGRQLRDAYMLRAVRPAGNIYQFLEVLGKTAIIEYQMEQGMSGEDAAIHAQKWLIDYSLVNRTVDWARNTPIMGAPFITFQYKSLPLMLETLHTAPWRLLPYLAMQTTVSLPMHILSSPALAGVALMVFLGADEEELMALIDSLPTWMRDDPGSFVIMGKDENGLFDVVNIGYFLPWAQHMSILNSVLERDLTNAFKEGGILSGPIMSVVHAITTGEDAFTGRPIFNPDDDTLTEDVGAVVQWTLTQALPPWLTEQGVAGRIWDLSAPGTAGTRPTTNKRGNPTLTWPQAVARFFGVNWYKVDAPLSRIGNAYAMQQRIIDLERYIKREANELPPRERMAYIRRRTREEVLPLKKERMEYLKKTRNLP